MPAQLYLYNRITKQIHPAEQYDPLQGLRQQIEDTWEREKQTQGMMTDMRKDLTEIAQERRRLQRVLWKAEYDERYRI